MNSRSEIRLDGDIPDLPTQYEELLDAVWQCERQARVDDRIDALIRFEQQQSQRNSCRRHQRRQAIGP